MVTPFRYAATIAWKPDADEEAAKWQLYYYLYVLKTKGIVRKAGGLWEVQDILCPWEN